MGFPTRRTLCPPTRIPDGSPSAPWPTASLGQPRPSACGDLAGLERVLHFANGWVIEHAFDSQRLRWRLADGSASGESDYRASSLRENLYLVDFLKQENGRPVSVSLVLDFDNQAFTAVLGHLPDRTACEQGLFSGPWPAGN